MTRLGTSCVAIWRSVLTSEAQKLKRESSAVPEMSGECAMR
jgi:hypothetical protein